MRNKLVLAALLALAALSMPARAQSLDDGRGRYALSPVEDGFLRLDKETGAVAMCARKSGTWVCEPVTDKAADSTGDKAKLEAENKVLRDRIKSLEEIQDPAKPGAEAETPKDPPGGKMQLPSEAEVDKALDYMERIFKKIRDRIQKYEPAPATPAPREGGSGTL